MANRIMTRNEFLYLYGALPLSTTGALAWPNLPTSGSTPAPTVGNACKFTHLKFPKKEELIRRPDKTGSRTVPAGSPGPRSANWQIDMSLAGNGVGGIVPDSDPLLVSLFGAPATVASGVSVTYSLTDSLYYLSAMSFRQPATANQRALAGALVTSATFNFGAGVNIASASFQGVAPWIVDSFTLPTAAAADSFGWHGMAYPSQPSSHATNGNAVTGFLGAVLVNGQTYANFKTGQIKLDTGVDLSEVFGSYYGGTPEASERNFTAQCSIYDQDDSTTQALYAIAEAKTPVTVVYQFGNVAGNTWTLTLNGVQFACPDIDDSGKSFVANFGDSQASGNGDDEGSLTIS